MRTVNILGVPIATVNMNKAIGRIEEWIGNGTKTFVTTPGIHEILESQYGSAVKRIHNAAGICLPVGMPTVWVG